MTNDSRRRRAVRAVGEADRVRVVPPIQRDNGPSNGGDINSRASWVYSGPSESVAAVVGDGLFLRRQCAFHGDFLKSRAIDAVWPSNFSHAWYDATVKFAKPCGAIRGR